MMMQIKQKRSSSRSWKRNEISSMEKKEMVEKLGIKLKNIEIAAHFRRKFRERQKTEHKNSKFIILKIQNGGNFTTLKSFLQYFCL